MNMNAGPQADQAADDPSGTEAAAGDPSATNPAAIKAATALVVQFARTLKNCRLYDASNPTVVRFREDMAGAFRRFLDEFGELKLDFTSDDVCYQEVSLYPARSRDDNLALAFYRDGIRSLTFEQGFDARELDLVLVAILQVTGQNSVDDDLVTLLWEAELAHLEMDYVPGEGDIGAGSPEHNIEPNPLPWPENPTDEATAPAAGVINPQGSRSDDWTTGEDSIEIEAGFEELEALAPTEVLRFRREYEAEHQVPNVTVSIAIANAYLGSSPNEDDRAEMARFLPRVMRLSVTNGMWLEAYEALRLLKQCDEEGRTLVGFAQELLQPISITSAIERVDHQEQQQVVDFIAFAAELGDPGMDWLNLVLAESQNRRNRRLFAEAIAHLCKDNPERLAPWIADPRWFVVRNVVHILGWIGGNSILPLLQGAERHPDARVRQEVVAALGQVDPRMARPLLLRMLDGADTRMLSAVLHQLSSNKDPGVARLLLSYLQAENFEERPLEEKRAIYSALSSVGGDEIIADLEGEVHRGNWFSRNQEVHRQAVARVIARIGTPLARKILERGMQSKRTPVRKACEDALTGAIHRE
ncbi:MAG: HEAT repeat domain-containing protein [Candidatus Eiseniibacteriota bacterium]